MIEKCEECPRCGEGPKCGSGQWHYDFQTCNNCGYGKIVAPEKHIERATLAIAQHLCSIWLTNGFCGPRDGECLKDNEYGKSAGRPDCMKFARGCIKAMASRGVKPVWVYDKREDT